MHMGCIKDISMQIAILWPLVLCILKSCELLLWKEASLMTIITTEQLVEENATIIYLKNKQIIP